MQMKKLKVLAVAACLMLVANETMAQTKIAYIDAETVLYLMPETAKIDTALNKFRADTLGKQYMNLMEDYQYKDSILRDTPTASKMPASVRAQNEKDRDELLQTLQNWQQIAQQAIQERQQGMLAPVMKKIQDAINAVAKEKGYTYVLSRESLIVAPDSDNLLPAVAAKLKVTLPPQLQPGYKPPVGGATR